MLANGFAFTLLCYLIADFLSGFWHWIEDRYFEETWPIVGDYIAKPNTLHHAKPSAFLDQTYLSRNWTTILPAVTAMFLGLLAGMHWQWSLVFVFVSQANEIHAWAHQKCSAWIRVLQDVGLLQSCRHHGEHHRSPFDEKYCVMSNWLNPFLDALDFWFTLEWIVEKTTGLKPKAI